MAKELANVRIYGDEASAVFVAPTGTLLPTDLAAPDPAFEELGWMSEDGLNTERATEVSTFNAWQGGTIVRKRVTSTDNMFTFQALEETALVLGLFYTGAEGATLTGVSTITVPSGTSVDERAFVLDFHDGDVHKRYVVPRGEVTDRGEVPHQNTELTVYEFTVTIYGPFEIITNNPAVDYS